MQIVSDGTSDWSLGQDAYKNPDRIQPNQYASGVNLSTRGGKLSPRPGFHRRELKFPAGGITNAYGYTRTYEQIWHSGMAQAAIPVSYGSNHYIVSVRNGIIFRTNIDTLNTEVLSDKIFLNSAAPRLNSSVALDTIIIHDFPDYPVYIKQDVVTRANPNHMVNGDLQPEAPISTISTYNQNRLFVANAGPEFTAGDVVGDLLTPEAPLTFTEVFTPSSPYVKQFFSLPVEDSAVEITAMGFLQALDASTGIGPLFVSSSSKLYFYQANQPRSNWGQGQFGGVLLANSGIGGPRCFVNVNSDLVFINSNGDAHALSTSRNDSQKWSNVPISREVRNYLKYHDKDLVKYAVLGYSNNRIFISANPYRTTALTTDQRPIRDYAHAGMVVMELDNLASFLSEGSPSWSGVWTGVNPTEIISINNRCFIMSKDGPETNTVNALYELVEDSNVDKIGTIDRQVRSIVYTKEYDFGQEFMQKKENSLVLHVNNLSGNVKIKIDRKPTHSSEWLKYADWQFTAATKTVEIPEDAFLYGLARQQLKQIVFGDGVVQGASPINDDEYSTFVGVQFRITLEGDYWELQHLKANATLATTAENQDQYYGADRLYKVYIALDKLPDWMIPELSYCEEEDILP